MSYVVLARRWRPQQFEDIIGQEHVSQTLANAIETGRIAHSYIFSGPRGVGKTTAARILAKALNCEQGPTKSPCNTCGNCQAITKGNSLDVLEIDGASNRGIDEIRNLRENIRFTPSSGKYRIYIIDEVHMLTKEAFNALLKTLEEPPKHAIFLFATTEIHRVPPTILSRCQRFDFKRIPTKTIIAHLAKICKNEKISISEEALLQIAKKADGSMRDSQSILDQLISFSGNDISTEQVAAALGIIDLEIFFKFTDCIHRGDLKEILTLCQAVYRDGYDLAEFLVGFEEHLRNILVCKALSGTELLNVSESYAENYMAYSRLFPENDLLRFLQQVSDLQNSLKWTTQPQMKFEIGMLKLSKMPAVKNIEQILEKLDLLKKKTNPGLSEAPPEAAAPKETAPVAESPEAPPELNITEIKKYWQELIQFYSTSKVTLANALELGQPVELSDNLITVEYAKANSFHMTLFKKNQRILENNFHQCFKTTVKLGIRETETDMAQSVAGENALPKDPKQISSKLKEDPLLNKLIDELGLEIST